MKTHFYLIAALYIVDVVLSGALCLARQEASATDSPINGPTSLATDNHGHLFLIELNENKVRRVDLKEGKILTVAGNGKECCYKDGAKATDVSLDFMYALAVDSAGNIFIGESGNIKRIDSHSGLISTIAGDGMSADTIDGGSARSVHFWNIDGLTVDGDGNLFVADVRQGKIFEIDAKEGTVRRYAGSGRFGYAGDGGLAVDASFRFAAGLATDRDGNLFVADSGNCAIRRVDRKTRTVKTIVITGGVEQNCVGRPDDTRPGAFPSDPATDLAGNVYFVEGAMDFVMRVGADTTVVSVLAGNGRRGFAGDSGAATEAELANPSGLAVDLDGNVFIAEYVNNRVRRVDAETKVITTVAGNGLPHRIDIQM